MRVAAATLTGGSLVAVALMYAVGLLALAEAGAAPIPPVLCARLLVARTSASVCLRVVHRGAIAAGKALGFVTTSTVGHDAA
jgi:hypothetical protein